MKDEAILSRVYDEGGAWLEGRGMTDKSYAVEDLVSSDTDKAESAALLGLAEYECPECAASVKESPEGTGGYICLNACHLTRYGLPPFGEVYKTAMRSTVPILARPEGRAQPARMNDYSYEAAIARVYRWKIAQARGKAICL